MSYKNILYEKDDHVVTITINRPKVHNCINWEIATELQKAWQMFRDDKDAFIAIMTGAGDKAFCSGADVDEFAKEIFPNPPKARIYLENLLTYATQ